MADRVRRGRRGAGYPGFIGHARSEAMEQDLTTLETYVERSHRRHQSSMHCPSTECPKPVVVKPATLYDQIDDSILKLRSDQDIGITTHLGISRHTSFLTLESLRRGKTTAIEMYRGRTLNSSASYSHLPQKTYIRIMIDDVSPLAILPKQPRRRGIWPILSQLDFPLPVLKTTAHIATE